MKKVVLCVFGIFCIFFFIFMAYRINIKVEKVLYKDLIDTVEKNNYSVVYFGDENERLKKIFYNIKKDYNVKTYYCNDFYKNDLVLKLNLKELDLKFPGYIIYNNSVAIKYINGTNKERDLNKYLNYYINNIIPNNEIYFKNSALPDEYINDLKSNNTIVTVFGKKSCKYCTKYLPIINDITYNYNLNTYYFDQEKYGQSELKKIYDINIIIPKECSGNNEDSKLSDGFAKPLTIITKSGKLIGCIKGYYDYDYILNKFKEYKLVEE